MKFYQSVTILLKAQKSQQLIQTKYLYPTIKNHSEKKEACRGSDYHFQKTCVYLCMFMYTLTIYKPSLLK